MRAVVGVDSKEHASNVLHLLARLKFADLSADLVHVVNLCAPVALGPAGAGELYAEFLQAQKDLGTQTIREARELACQVEIPSRSFLVEGAVAPTLLEQANLSHADLIAVCGSLHGPVSNFLHLGVSRHLAIGASQSVLVARGNIQGGEGLRIVFATDHSEYCDRAFDRFLAMKPKGITHVRVLTAIDVETERERFFTHLMEKHWKFRLDAALQRLEGANQRYVDRLHQEGIEADSEVSHVHPNLAIPVALAEERADLLVMGAHGHGFMERLVSGSVALHQVVAADYSTLIVRAV